MAMRRCDRRGLELVNQRGVFIEFGIEKRTEVEKPYSSSSLRRVKRFCHKFL
jgi:hypothetical protein